MNEKIYCAAIWYAELNPISEVRNPENISEGVVVLGHRHGDIIKNVFNLLGKRTVMYGDNSVGKTVQGFLTTKNRFVDRDEAAEIAWKENQILDKSISNPNHLYSEDIY